MTQNMKKLAGEVDKCLKKVTEGAEIFEDIWQKVQSATNLNQKEKYECELKREIKKLQRLREQIKVWVASSEIKDKKLLLENRKLIELQMERFRSVEKEMKIKTYSKEGLGQANKLDAETKEYELCREWLNDTISKLNLQIDQMESEMESLYAGAKKKKLDKDKGVRVDDLNSRIVKHKYHANEIEHILRSLDNKSVEVDLVNKVKDDVEYYLDNCQEPDFIDFDGMYDELDLRSEVDLESVKLLGEKDENGELLISNCFSDNSPPNSICKSPILKISPCKIKKTPVASSVPIVMNGISISISTAASTPAITCSARKALFKNRSELLPSDDILPSSNDLLHQKSKDKTLHTFSNNYLTLTTSSMISSSDFTNNSPGMTSSSPSSKNLSTVEQDAVQVVRNHVNNLKFPGFNLSNAICRTTNSTSLSEIMATPKTCFPASSETYTTLSSLNAPVTVTSMSSYNATSSNYATIPYEPVTNKSNQPYDTPVGFGLKKKSLPDSAQSSYIHSHAPTVSTPDIKLHPVQSAAPLAAPSLSPEKARHLKMLEISYKHLPQRQDGEKIRPYLPRSTIPIASYHHHQPPPYINTLDFFQRLSTEILFFIFYYQEGTKAQYLAAKALKKQSWRFHTKYMMWFQRHEEPKRITDEYEEGTYIFFDYEKWSQRKRDGFTFEYRFLEDKDLP